MTVPNHFSSALLSNFQSAIGKIATSPVTHDLEAALNRRPLKFEDSLVSAAAYACHAFECGQKGESPSRPPNQLEQIAKAVLNIAVCKMQGDPEGVAAAEEGFKKFGSFDPRWLECLSEFIAHYSVTDHGDVPYKRWHELKDFVQDDLPDACKIGIIGDWGTGDKRAQFLLNKLVEKNVDVVIHLGDIYYSCTTAEANTFFENVVNAVGKHRKVKIYTLCGNHDMYSGGAPYYALVNRLGQPASFFCLRNKSWQLLAGDTGYNDFDPTNFGSIPSWLQDNDESTNYSELKWHLDKLQNNGGRRTVFMTHHQPFSRNAGWSGSATNQRLLEQLKSQLGNIDLWLWGHEHNQVIYAPFAGIAKGRCVGASAIPTPSEPDMYQPDKALVGQIPELVGNQTKLGIDGSLGLYNLGYATLELDGSNCTERYYEVSPSTNEERLLFEANI